MAALLALGLAWATPASATMPRDPPFAEWALQALDECDLEGARTYYDHETSPLLEHPPLSALANEEAMLELVERARSLFDSGSRDEAFDLLAKARRGSVVAACQKRIDGIAAEWRAAAREQDASAGGLGETRSAERPFRSGERDMPAAAAIQSLIVRYTWKGYAPRSRRNIVAMVKLLPEGWVRKVRLRDFVPVDERTVIDGGDALVERFARALRHAAPSLGMGKCINHTDDYPEMAVSVMVGDKTAWRLKTTSNCLGLAPWNLTDGKRLLAVVDPALSETVSALLGETVRGTGPPPAPAAEVEEGKATFVGIFSHLRRETRRLLAEEGRPRQRTLYKVSPQVAALVWMDAGRFLPLLKDWSGEPGLHEDERALVVELVASVEAHIRG